MKEMTLSGSKIFTEFQKIINFFKNIFTNFAYGISFSEKVSVGWARISGCTHPDPFLNDLGDEDNQYWYCFRCDRKVN